MSKVFKALIIDDELNFRKPIYERLFASMFDITWMDNSNEMANLNLQNKYHLIVCDLFLTKSDSLKLCKKILNLVDEKIPVMLVSSRWMNDSGKPIDELNEISENKNIIKYISWSMVNGIDEKHLEALGREFFLDFQRAIKSILLPLDPNETVKIWHIGDLQFGGINAPFANVDYQMLINELTPEMPTLIAVSGDISEAGEHDQFEGAKSWFSKIGQHFWSSEKLDNRLLLIPGNHDCHFDSFAQGKYHYDFTKKDFVTVEKAKTNFSNCEKYAFLNYREFVACMLDDQQWLNSKYPFTQVNDAYAPYGLRFINLHTTSKIEPGNHRGIGIDIDACKKVMDHVNREPIANVFTVLMSHYGPADLGYDIDNDEMRRVWAEVLPVIDSLHVDLWLYGHRHSLKVSTVDEVDTRTVHNLHAICTGTLRLAANKRPEDSLRGYATIELLRKENQVFAANVSMYEIRTTSIAQRGKTEKIYFSRR